MARKQFTDAQRAEWKENKAAQVAEAHKRLQAGVAELLTDGGAWQRYLTFMAKMHHYSFNNSVLILMQMPQATMVMGYGNKEGTSGWKSVGRHVRKREDNIALGIRPDGIRILAPFSGKREDEDPETGELTEHRFKYFKTVCVFDVSQTEGDPIPKPQKPVPLKGNSPELQDRFGMVAEIIESDGWTVKSEVNGKAEGSADPRTRTIWVRPDRSDADRLATIVHELAHVKLAHVENMEAYRQHRGRQEAEAESVAFLVLSGIGIDTSDYSLPYVAGWSNGDAKIVAEVASRVSRCALALLDRLEDGGENGA